jgi:hypothetical protein
VGQRSARPSRRPERTLSPLLGRNDASAAPARRRHVLTL